MTQDEIIEMAKEAGFVLDDMCYVRFAKLVAAKEREACAKLADECTTWNRNSAETIAAAIRARGET